MRDVDELLSRLLNTNAVAEQVTRAIREDQVQGLTARDYVHAFQLPDDGLMGTRFPEQSVNVPKLFEFLALMVCPPPCAGHVNSEGWHQLCEGRAHAAILALGFQPPELTPIPEKSDKPDWDF